MTDRLMVDLGVDGRVSLSAWLDGELPGGPAPQPFKLSWPLDTEALEDLRWYLEDYLRAPFGVYGDRGASVAARLGEWGEAIFRALFGAGPARDAYVRVRTTRGVSLEVVLRSSSPALLGLPWELLTDPARPTPLALDLVGVTRSLPAEGLAAAFVASGERLRVLMVISRPRGAADVGYRMIARPLLQRLEAVRGQVDLVVLRPPTLEALEGTLAEAARGGQPFQVVHFDGHGVLAGRGRGAAGSGAPVAYRGSEVEGVLLFEKPGGGSEEVSAAAFAQVLKAAEVPVVVLNACQSGAVGTELEAAVATRLLQEGAASVVAMGYAVYAVAAAEFMAAFYERLFAGDGLTEAVGAGRRRLHQRPERPSPKGMLQLADWVVPVHYLRRDVRFPHLRGEGSREVSLDEALDRLRDASADHGGDGLEPIGAFVGRDGLFYELEVAARLQRVVVLYGPGGTGKTELAKAFGRWWRDTGGVEQPQWVIMHSFEPGVASFGLDGVVSDIGLRVFGAEFARRSPDQRREVVERLLAEHRLLLIWDNFESVFAMPDPTGVTPPLDEAGRQELRGFLGRLTMGGASSVIITSRTDEGWLGDVRRIPVGGLAPDEAIECAQELLAPYPGAGPRRAKRAFGELLEWLDGHPLSMRLVLPHLQTTEPEQLLCALRGIGELPGVVVGDAGRTTSLPASVTYSFDHLSPTTRRLLVAVCLFQGVASGPVLTLFSHVDGTPEAFAGASKENWADALDDAARVGLLTPIGAGLYRIHPALPTYLATRWRSEDPDAYDTQRDAATRALLAAYTIFSVWLSEQIDCGDAGLAFTLIEHQRRTLGQLFGYALESGEWDGAAAIAPPLKAYWNARGLSEEAQGWVDRVRLATETPDGVLPSLDTSAGVLWLSFVGSQGNRQVLSGPLDAAEETSREVLAMLENQTASQARQEGFAGIYHQLASVAEHRGRLDEAEELYQRALGIAEEIDDWPTMAMTYHQLGILAQRRGRLDEAEELYQRALGIKKKLRDWPNMASTYHQLGMVAQERRHLYEAEAWYRRSLGITEELGNRPGMARTYHELGILADLRGHLDEAEEWYRRSLAIDEELGDRPGMASTYHQLGILAQWRGRLDEAEEWYRRSLAINEEFGDRLAMAITYGILGELAAVRGQLGEALEWTVRCVALFDEFPHPATGAGAAQLAQLTAALGIDTLTACWRTVTGGKLPQAVRDFVESSG